ncbi:MAG: GGDEF domain-containing protein [Fulvimarina manganoxydans]|uniref:GGDEF domain-containing protein n=1 Tax=Fulvimarina manganoxydans TaxID=937218 RepID=UPI0023521652|nr:GGDEF domain-containing protein [Fulvimarina manganoxydans]MCK5930881.1 GGDEF domain-containing protein [Fulvimarina manganoxydans]
MTEKTSIFDSVEAYRRAVLFILLLFTATFGAVFSILNFRNDNYIAMAGELAMGCFALCLAPVIRTTHRLLLWSFVYLLLFNSTMMAIIATPEASPSVFAWVLMIPILSHMLLGRALGGSVTLVFLAIAFWLYVTKYGSDAALGSDRALLNVAGVALCIFGFSYVYETSRARAEIALKRRAYTDPLTGLGNRAAFYHRFGEAIARFERQGAGPAIVLLDIDHFKAINDDHGHETGDDALKRLSAILIETIRPSDDAFRYGGEEFCLLLDDTSPAEAANFAETLRKVVEAAEMSREDHTIRLTVSLGVATVCEDGTDLKKLLQAADQRLYEAKAKGRNRVVSG